MLCYNSSDKEVMKKKHQIFKVLLLIAIYCSGIYLTANTPPFLSLQSSTQNKPHEGNFTKTLQNTDEEYFVKKRRKKKGF